MISSIRTVAMVALPPFESNSATSSSSSSATSGPQMMNPININDPQVLNSPTITNQSKYKCDSFVPQSQMTPNIIDPNYMQKTDTPDQFNHQNTAFYAKSQPNNHNTSQMMIQSEFNYSNNNSRLKTLDHFPNSQHQQPTLNYLSGPNVVNNINEQQQQQMFPQINYGHNFNLQPNTSYDKQINLQSSYVQDHQINDQNTDYHPQHAHHTQNTNQINYNYPNNMHQSTQAINNFNNNEKFAIQSEKLSSSLTHPSSGFIPTNQMRTMNPNDSQSHDFMSSIQTDQYHHQYHQQQQQAPLRQQSGRLVNLSNMQLDHNFGSNRIINNYVADKDQLRKEINNYNYSVPESPINQQNNLENVLLKSSSALNFNPMSPSPIHSSSTSSTFNHKNLHQNMMNVNSPNTNKMSSFFQQKQQNKFDSPEEVMKSQINHQIHAYQQLAHQKQILTNESKNNIKRSYDFNNSKIIYNTTNNSHRTMSPLNHKVIDPNYNKFIKQQQQQISSTTNSPSSISSFPINNDTKFTNKYPDKLSKSYQKNLDNELFHNDNIKPSNNNETLNKSFERESKTPQIGIDANMFVEVYQNQIMNSIKARLVLLNAALQEYNKNSSIYCPKTVQKIKIESLALRLAPFQKYLRNKMLDIVLPNMSLMSSMNVRAFRRPKKFTLRDSRCTDRLELQKRNDIKRQNISKNLEFLSNVEFHVEAFKVFHYNCIYRANKCAKSVLTYHENLEKEYRKEQERIEKERVKRLMLEDEEGYRELIDKEKNKRLHQILEQTDNFVKSLTLKLKTQKNVTGSQKKGFTPNKIKIEDLSNDINSEDIDISHEFKDDFEEDDKNNSFDDEDDDDNNENKQSLDKFDNCRNKKMTKSTSYYNIAHSIVESIENQPNILIGGKLKNYQIRGLEWMNSLYINNLNGILADEMGLGKTIQTISFIAHLIENKSNYGPFLILVPLSTVVNWIFEFEKWAPSIIVRAYNGDPMTRKSVAYQMKMNYFNVCISTYEYVIRDKHVLSKFSWKVIIIDEGHRMKNQHCKLTQILNKYYSSDHRLLLTGTPLQNNLPELWSLLNFILPKIFNSVDSFEQWFATPFENLPGEQKIELNAEENMLIIRRLHLVLRPFLLRRLKKEVELELPDKTEHIVRVEQSSLQSIIYENIKKGMVLSRSHQNQNSRSLMNILMHLRKLCNHPFIFKEVRQIMLNNSTIKNDLDKNSSLNDHLKQTNKYLELLVRTSGKLQFFDNILPKLFHFNHKVLVFCQMTQTMNLIEEYLIARHINFLRLDGNTKYEDRMQMLKRFNEVNSEIQVFVLSTRAGGVGLNLQSADTVIIYDSDWNPHQDLQAQDRAHRIGQKNDVIVLRLVTSNSIEEKILAAARFKLSIDDKVIQAGMFNEKSTNSERKRYLEQILMSDTQVSNQIDDSSNSNIQNNKDDLDDNDDQDDDIADSEYINQVISRNEEEFNYFQEIDYKFRTIDMKDLNYYTNPERNFKFDSLIKKDELPPILFAKETPSLVSNMNDNEQMITNSILETNISDLALKPRAASLKRSNNASLYQMSDAQWIKSMEKQSFNDTVHNNEISNQNLIMQQNLADDSKKRKVSKYDNLNNSDIKQNSKTSQYKIYKEIYLKLLQMLEDFSIPIDVNDDIEITKIDNKTLVTINNTDLRYPAELFIKLPTKKELPDYYQIISRPIDFHRLRTKIKSNFYKKNFEAFKSDVILMFKNAQEYNRDDSQIFKDSQLLENKFFEFIEEMRKDEKYAKLM